MEGKLEEIDKIRLMGKETKGTKETKETKANTAKDNKKLKGAK